MDINNLVDTLAFIARAEKFGLTYAKVCQTHIENIRQYGKGDYVGSFRHNAGNFFNHIHRHDRRERNQNGLSRR